MKFDESKKMRSDLKGFKKNDIPTEQNFTDLINGMANYREDGFLKKADTPLMIAAGENNKKVIEFYSLPSDDKPVWSIGLQSTQNGAKKGLSIEKGDAESCLFIDESKGTIGIGTSKPKTDGRLHVLGDVYIEGSLYVKDDAYKNLPTAWRQYSPGIFSDLRLKKDVNTLSESLNKLLQLRGVRYKWKNPLLFGGTEAEQTGFIAQEVEEVFPQWIYEQKVNGEDYKLLEINGLWFQALTVESIKELYAICKQNEKEKFSISRFLDVNGKIRVAQGKEKGLFFSDGEEDIAAWMRCSKIETRRVLEIGTDGDINLNIGGNLMISDSSGKHLLFSSDQIIAEENGLSSSFFLQKGGGRTEIGGDLTVKGKTSLKSGLEVTGALFVIGDAVFGLNENNKRFIFHSRTNGNGDFLQITHDTANGGWEWGQGITIRRGGNVGIGTTNPTAKLHVAGDLHVNGAIIGRVVSDKRLKKDISTLNGSLGKLIQLRGVSYKWENPLIFGGTTTEQRGFIANEVELVFPHWIYEQKINGENYKLLEINGLEFQALTVEAVKELHQKLDANTASLAAVGAALANLQLGQLKQEERIKKIEERIKLGGN